MQRLLLLTGLLLVALGLLWPWLARLPLGRLPGDILVDRPGMRVFVPLMTCLLISMLLSIILWFLRR